MKGRRRRRTPILLSISRQFAHIKKGRMAGWVGGRERDNEFRQKLTAKTSLAKLVIAPLEMCKNNNDFLLLRASDYTVVAKTAAAAAAADPPTQLKDGKKEVNQVI